MIERTISPGVPMVELFVSDLPAFCPNPRMPLWSSHPRVFLDVVNQSEVICPYCSTRYRLNPNAHVLAEQFGTRDLHQERNQHAVLDPAKGSASFPALKYSSETPNLTAGGSGSTTLEMMTQWLRKH